MKVEWDPDALAEFREAARFYNARQRGLGSRFRERVREAIRRVRHDPTSFEKVELNIHRCPVKQFPYNVYFQVQSEDKQIVIFAVAHHKRRFGYWKYRANPDDESTE